ncbi:HAD family hydrolase [Fulvivirga ligni]|uniref:HAD family hydrolase n=1 Tax=Fulvivirga ligni TaxID=2904246 RepID=UPI001F324726|nr:HAD family phosphatase [Fulvivirga ligni]UII20466.1 HAD family phosphatase [Fulvivirga ligni]
MKKENIKNIIFDLGGVIINLRPDYTVVEFAKLAGISEDEILDKYLNDEPFKLYEKGLTTDEEFHAYLKEITGHDDVKNLEKAWNAMLLDIPQERLELLKRLRKDYRLFLLSNTNEIHLRCFTEIASSQNKCSIEDYFDHAYYSHHMNKRKPDAEIYEQVLEEQGLVAEETLFIDDNADNIAGAGNLGIQTLHVTGDHTLKEFFDEGEQ